MTIEKYSGADGVSIHLDPGECELFSQLARDAETAAAGIETATRARDAAPSYFSLSLALGQTIRSFRQSQPTLPDDQGAAVTR
jgi:hypothetical protein